MMRGVGKPFYLRELTLSQQRELLQNDRVNGTERVRAKHTAEDLADRLQRIRAAASRVRR